MSSYRQINPVSQLATYSPNTNVDFTLNLDNEKLVPGTVCLTGECNVYQTGNTQVAAGVDVQYDGLVGYHGIVRDIQTEFRSLGVVESFQQYPRYVKMKALATVDVDSVGMDSALSAEGRLPASEMSSEYIRNEWNPFSLKLDNVLNNASGPISSSASGQIRMRIRLAPNEEFLFGRAWENLAPNYVVRNLKLNYEVMADDGKLQPVTMVIHNSWRGVLESSIQNLSTFVPGLCEAVHISFIKQTDETTSARNYLACQPPLGKPHGQDNVEQSYGLERLDYAVNDVDTALLGWTMEYRDEMVYNGLRSFQTPPDRYGRLLDLMKKQPDPDGYIVGIPFGAPINFTNNKFAADMQSAITSSADFTASYFYFRMINVVQA